MYLIHSDPSDPGKKISRCSQECVQIIDLFEVINSEDVKNEIIGEIGNEVLEEIDTDICRLIISIKKDMINGAATSISDGELLFLYVKKFNKN